MFVKELAKVAGIKKKKDVWLYLVGRMDGLGLCNHDYD
jgi:hypothetical protein